MKDRKVNILGVQYTIKVQDEDENPILKNCDGYCDWTVKELVVENGKSGTLGDMDAFIRKVIRHEIVHAFLFESGLCENSASSNAWATNEEMVEWFARQGQKIHKAWCDAKAVDE